MIYTNKYEKINALSNICIEYGFFYFFFRMICQNSYVVSHKNTHLLDVLNVILNLLWLGWQLEESNGGYRHEVSLRHKLFCYD